MGGDLKFKFESKLIASVPERLCRFETVEAAAETAVDESNWLTEQKS